MTINAKLGDPTANSYVTMFEATSYVAKEYDNTNWTNLNATEKEQVLIQACRDINSYNFIDPPYYSYQKLSFPNTNHDTITGDVATPITKTSFKHADFTSDTYGDRKSYSNYWKYGSVHIIAGTPLNDIREIETSSISTDVVVMTASFTATPTANTDFRAFEPLDENVKYAQIIQAVHIADNKGLETITTYKAVGAEKVEIGDVAITFKKGSGAAFIPLASKAKKLLSRYLRRGIRVGRA